MPDEAKPPTKPASAMPLGWPQVAIVAIVMGALVWIVFLALDNAADAGDAATVLGTVVPGIAAIGAAVFGIPLAYQSGKAGKDEAVKQSHEEGRTSGKKEAAARINQVLSGPPAEGALAAMGATDDADTAARVRAALVDLLGAP